MKKLATLTLSVLFYATVPVEASVRNRLSQIGANKVALAEMAPVATAAPVVVAAPTFSC